MKREDLRNCKRIVVKVGTSSITYPTGKVNLGKMELLARELSDLHSAGRELILTSSGAVGAGVGKLNCPPPSSLPEKQALAAIGQGILMHMYEKFFSEYSKSVAQVLLTRDCFSDPVRYLNSRNTLFSLLNFGVIPIINENDTVAVEELKFGDNDTLSAMVTCNAEADLLLILSDVNGLYDSDPRKNEDARLISQVSEITVEMVKNSKAKGGTLSSGGMFTKLSAARMTMANGIPLVIASSDEPNVIRRVADGEAVGTLFLPSREGGYASRRQWIAVGSAAAGSVTVDDGAAEALLRRGKSLLPSGVLRVEGVFKVGDVVGVKNASGVEIARGITNYGHEDAARILGRRTSEIEDILGRQDYEELIHRNNMAVLQ
ncbi:MAG: glutamate 5-kinase [Synergistaceae bacterium]|jgi:glutamate 5-kinase|nr:glutamate 5-kinase [Synergistaceae bacterium]